MDPASQILRTVVAGKLHPIRDEEQFPGLRIENMGLELIRSGLVPDLFRPQIDVLEIRAYRYKTV